MNLRQVFLLVGVVSILLGGFSVIQEVAAKSSSQCASVNRVPVTFLARPGLEQTYTRLENTAAYLDSTTDRTYVYVRSLMSAISPYPGSVKWDDGNRTATFVYGTHSLAITIPPGASATETAYLNGDAIPMTAFICEGKLYAPARAVTDAVQVGIKWYTGNTVVADPAWGPTPPTTSDGSSGNGLGGRVASGRLLPSAPCDAFPDGVLSLITSPRQAARAAACRLARGQ